MGSAEAASLTHWNRGGTSWMRRQAGRFATGALIAALALAPAAEAQDPAAGAGSVEIATGVQVQNREDELGDLRRYVSETTTSTTLVDGRAHERSNRQAFELSTMAVTARGLLLRFTLREAQARDPEQPYLDALLKGWVDIPLEVMTNRSGAPERIVNWPRAREAYSAALARLAPEHGEIASGVVAALDGMEDGPRAAAVLADLVLLAAAQPRQPVREGRVEVAPETLTASSGASMVVTRFAEFGSVEADACTAVYQSGTTMAAGADASTAEALRATLSTWDGWVIGLEQTSETTAPAGRMMKTVTIRRDPPGCGAPQS